MVNRKEFTISIFILLFLVSCSTNYHIIYNTYIQGSKEKVNYFQDDKFMFDFNPVNNGILFTIKNLTDKSAYLIWDRTYFIEPNGNSYKAANMDALEVEKQLSDKEKYESILPPQSLFKRFTTSDINAHKYQTEYITINKNYEDNLSIDKIIYSEYLTAGLFWPIEVKKDNLITIIDYIVKNNNMGVGFVIKQGEKEYEYKFNFKFKRASAMQEITVDYGQLGVPVQETKWVEKYSAEEGDWIWKKIEEK